MNTLDTPFGWMFAALAALFTLGSTAPFARRFYPSAPSFLRRLAAPVIFALLAVACFRGAALPALSFVVILGAVQIVVSRRIGRKPRPLA